MYCEVLAEHVNFCVADVAVKDWTSTWSTGCESALGTAVCSQRPTVDTTSGSCHFTVKWSWWNSDRSQCCHQCLQCQQGVFLPVCSSALSGLKLVNDHYSATVGERSIVISLSVCVSVFCLSLCISLEPFHWSPVQIPSGHGSFLLWWWYNTLSTFSFMDGVTFGRNGPYGDVWKAEPLTYYH